MTMKRSPSENNKRLSRGAVWFFMLAKRLFRRPGFVALLLLIPVLGGAVALSAREDSGITTVALAALGKEGDISHKIVEELASSESVVNFIVCGSEEEAKDKVIYGKAESAWVFPDGMEDAIEEYAGDFSRGATLATVYQSRETPILRITREKLNGAVFKYLARAIYKTFSEDAAALGVDPDPAEFERYFDEAAFKDGIVNFEYLGTSAPPDTETSYLVSPVRGLSSLAALLCTLASALYSMQDERRGFYSRIPLSKRLPVFFAASFASSLISSLMAALSVVASGAATSFLPELGAALSLAVTSAALCTAFCRIFSSPFALGAAIPPIVLAAAVVCPVFIGIKFAPNAELLFPVTYAIRAVRAPRYLGYAAIYSAICLAAAYAADLIRRRRA